MDEQLTLRSDSIDQITDVLNAESDYDDHGVPRDRRLAIADTIDGQRGNYVGDTAIALCGLPGAGKSHVADMLGDVYHAPVVSMGDAIRANLPDEARGDSDALGDFAAVTRADRPETIPEWTADLAREERAEVVIIDGVRSLTDYEVLNEEFGEFYLLHVDAPFYIRLRRVKMRNREGEGAFTPVSLAERDERELYDLGFAELMAAVEPDVRLDNDAGPNVLSVRLREAIHGDEIDVDIVDDSALSKLDAKN
ncbi:adenylate kinase [Halorubrum sodomense tailed virus 2]|uniref:Adenylate kinase n=1 Tax=Halorubrum sodomense tailed virus 2 TaxID=1262527 RepID=L7TN82_9CAUD|nr:kinase [Halorubrum sodomense tailed virus 2]AGC34317.1 adenylate kinase [Halorubrum sodomense tailed virus 2]